MLMGGLDKIGCQMRMSGNFCTSVSTFVTVTLPPGRCRCMAVCACHTPCCADHCCGACVRELCVLQGKLCWVLQCLAVLLGLSGTANRLANAHSLQVSPLRLRAVFRCLHLTRWWEAW
jgi:hypothetical protein